MATKSSSKCARVSISVSLKKKICAYMKSHPKATQEEIRSLIFKEDSVDIGRTTISDILRDADKWASVEDSTMSASIPFEELVLYSTVFLSFFHDKGNCMSIFVIRHLIYPAHFAGNKYRQINESPLYKICI